MGARELWLNVVLPWQERRKLSEAERPSAVSAAPMPQPVKRLKSSQG
jgi:hypothetical protein